MESLEKEKETSRYSEGREIIFSSYFIVLMDFKKLKNKYFFNKKQILH
jgi:hypothetical protein